MQDTINKIIMRGPWVCQYNDLGSFYECHFCENCFADLPKKDDLTKHDKDCVWLELLANRDRYYYELI